MVLCFKRLLVLSSLLLSIFIPFSHASTVNLSAMEWPPFYGKDLPENGFVAAITREAFQRSGYQLDITFMPWKRALNGSKNGRFDGVLGLYYADEREQFLSYTNSIYQNEQIFIKKRKPSNGNNNDDSNHLNSWTTYLIAAQLGTLQAKDAQDTGLNIYPTNNNLMSLSLLIKERVDLALMAHEHLRYIQIKENSQNFTQENIEIMMPPFRIYQIYNAFSRKSPRCDELTQAFNQGLFTMKQDGTYEAILTRFGIASLPVSD